MSSRDPGRNVILPRVAHAPHGEGIKLMWWKREKQREGRMNGGDLLRAETDWEVKLKADGRAGTCRTLKSVWSRFPHVFFFFFFPFRSAWYAKKRHSGFNPL